MILVKIEICVNNLLLSLFIHLLELAVKFDQAMYTVVEDIGVVKVSLSLSHPSTTIINITVLSTDESATGMYIGISNLHHSTNKHLVT